MYRLIGADHSGQMRSQLYRAEEAFQGAQEVCIGSAGPFHRCQQHLETLVGQQNGSIGMTDVDAGEHGSLRSPVGLEQITILKNGKLASEQTPRFCNKVCLESVVGNTNFPTKQLFYYFYYSKHLPY